MPYNNKSYRFSLPMSINISNSETPAEFAANVFKVMESRNDTSVKNAIDTMANQNSTYKGQNIKQIPEINELYRRVANFNGPISQNDLATNLDGLFGNAVPGSEQQQTLDAYKNRQADLGMENELYQIMMKALPMVGNLNLKLTNGEIWAILRQRPEYINAIDTLAKQSPNYQKLVQDFNQKLKSSMAPKETLPDKKNSSNIQEFVQKLMQFAQEDRIERLDIALEQYGKKSGTINGVNIMSIPAIKQIFQEAKTNPVRLDAASLTNRLNQLSGSGTQPQQTQSVSQMYNIDQNLSNYKRTMDLQMQSYNSTREESFKQKFKATFGMYSQYIRERQINDKDYETYKKMYEMLPQQGQPLQENVEKTRDTLGV
jgi:hypothetical protein